MFDGELSFALKLAREMGRPDWRAMLAGMSSTEYADWHRFYSTHYFHDVLLDMHFSGLTYTVTWPGQNAITGGAVADFDNLFDAAIARADETIRGYMGTSATMTSGEQSGAVIRGVFDDPENISYAGQGVRVEGSSPSLFVRTDEVRQLRRGDTLTIGEENFWIDRVSPDDGGSCHLWLGRGVPPAVNRRR